MPQSSYRHGETVMVDHTPGVAVAAGDVVVQNNCPFVAHSDIPANRQGALSVGGAVYEMTGDAAILVGKKVYWDNTAKKVTETVASNKGFGWTVSPCAANNGLCLVYHQPF